MLVRDHNRSNNHLRLLAATRSMELPRELPHEQRGRVQLPTLREHRDEAQKLMAGLGGRK